MRRPKREERVVRGLLRPDSLVLINHRCFTPYSIKPPDPSFFTTPFNYLIRLRFFASVFASIFDFAPNGTPVFVFSPASARRIEAVFSRSDFRSDASRQSGHPPSLPASKGWHGMRMWAAALSSTRNRSSSFISFSLVSRTLSGLYVVFLCPSCRSSTSTPDSRHNRPHRSACPVRKSRPPQPYARLRRDSLAHGERPSSSPSRPRPQCRRGAAACPSGQPVCQRSYGRAHKPHARSTHPRDRTGIRHLTFLGPPVRRPCTCRLRRGPRAGRTWRRARWIRAVSLPVPTALSAAGTE